MTGTRQTAGGGRHRVGATAPPRAERPNRQSRTGRALLAGGLAVATATGGLLVAQTASAAVADVPAFPDNIVVFPDRDFVSVEGYSAHAGETATIQVTRGTQVIGSAKALVDGGGIAFEINHPGGFCWGAGPDGKPATGLPQVTPDIQAGDKVSVTFPDGSGGTTTTSSAKASDAVLAPDGVTVTIGVTLGADVNPAQIEQRIVEPALLPLIGKRDARAVPGGATPAPRGGYTSSLEAVPGTPGAYVATYKFDDPAAAKIAANPSLGERAMSWQVEDADANRQGLTIAEFGEAGGPGMGGCPLGPTNSTPAAGSAIVTLAGASATVKWTPAASVPTASPVQSYSVVAVNKTAVAGRQAMVGAQYPAGVTTGTVDGLDPAATYDFQVRAITADGKASTPFTIGTSAGTATQTPGVAPQLTLTPSANPDLTVAVPTNLLKAATDAGSTIWYTLQTDPTIPNPVVVGGSVSDAALAFPTGGLTIDKKVTVHLAALNNQNLMEVVSGTYQPGAAVAPVAPAAKAAGGQTSATVSWTPVAGENYTVTTLKSNEAATPVFTQVGQPVAATSPFVVPNLTKGTYGFTVTATNSAGTATSTRADAVVTGVVDTLSVSKATWKTGDFRVIGTSSSVTGTVSVRTGSATGPVVTGMTQALTAAVAPATGGTFDIRLRAGVPTTKPAQVWVTSSNGGVIGPIAVANG